MSHAVTHSEIVHTLGAKAQVMIVGDWERREFSTAIANILDNILDAHDWPHASDMDEACDLLLHCQQPPELIFLAQPLPGIYRQADIDRLQQLVPLARLVLVAGSWCEGELRTGTPPNGVIRVYWYELASWWQAALRRRESGRCPLWSLPLVHPQAGRYSFSDTTSSDTTSSDTTSSDNALPPATSTFSVQIGAADYAVYEALSSCLSAYGLQSCWQGRNENFGSQPIAAGSWGGGIWDGGQLSDRELVQLTNFCQPIDGPVIVLLDFPRVEHLEQARAAGATTVFAKPYIVEELVLSITTRPTPSAESLAAIQVHAPANSESG